MGYFSFAWPALGARSSLGRRQLKLAAQRWSALAKFLKDEYSCKIRRGSAIRSPGDVDLAWRIALDHTVGAVLPLRCVGVIE